MTSARILGCNQTSTPLRREKKDLSRKKDESYKFERTHPNLFEIESKFPP